MKRILITLALILAFSLSTSAQNGIWTGKLQVSGMEMDLVFDISDTGGTLDVPDQGAKGIPVNVTRTALGSLKLDIPSINASFEGVWTGKLIAGTFTQHGLSFPMTLNPGAPVLKRPQTPTGPFPYRTEAVTFSNGDAVLKGTLTFPEDCNDKTPVFLMVTGSGLQNRDEEMFGHKPFAVIADAFARNGIATLRYDDRGFGESTGDTVLCTTEDLKDDAAAGVEMLRQRFSRVGVLGHSEGGTIALMLAAEGKTDFVISLAGMAVSGASTLLSQNRHALQSAGLPESDIDSYCRLLSDTFDALVAGLPLPSADGYGLPDILKQNYATALPQFKTPYMKYFLGLNVSKRLESVRCPVLALNGTKDIQVSYGDNLAALKTGLQRGASGHNVFKAEKGLNHLFQHCTTGELSEYKQIEETISPLVLEEMVLWIKEVSK